MVTALFAALWLTLLLARGTRIGRAMHRWMVEKPAALGSRIGTGGLLMILLMAVGTALVWYFLERDGIMLLSMGMPEILHVIAAMELTTWLEVAFTVAVTASATRFSAVVVAVRSLFAGKRERRTRPARRELPAANDDEDRRFALAA
ncbi:hypothetical protein OF829_07635 [Sphingomonas sp. LB-2]|uniref:hypothetical protein n=1 Tax=Sphingomonas caeni TaxID=2984949 RepID=UPI00222E5A26|nr:hypothetical protein [Sphingomonas caeni]MCW3847107.1 hypothetical protein [Sphingomonas caeni]